MEFDGTEYNKEHFKPVNKELEQLKKNQEQALFYERETRPEFLNQEFIEGVESVMKRKRHLESINQACWTENDFKFMESFRKNIGE